MFQNLAQMFFGTVARLGSKPVIRFKQEGEYKDVTYHQAAEYVQRMANVLKQKGIKKGDRVAILSENRPEWWYADLAILSIGAISVPIYATNSPKECSYIIKDCDAKAIFISTREQWVRLESELKQCKSLQTFISFDDSMEIGSFWNLLESDSPQIDIQYEIRQITLDEVATIIYTSGTTGDPKGVMLTHGNLLSNIDASERAMSIRTPDVLLSILPLSHVFERMAGFYMQIYIGTTTAFAENMKSAAENLVETSPTIVLAVPRFFEKLHENIWLEIRSRGEVVVKLFELAVRTGKKFSHLKRAGHRIPFLLNAVYQFWRILIFSKIRKKVGGRIRFFVSGGAPLSKEIAEFFHSIDILILEGYGLTETSPVISSNHEDKFRFGSVGLPLDNLQLRIAEDGEILVKGPNVMKGYYKKEIATQEVIHDGWFSTGDIGHLDSDNFLYITDRKKDLIKTSGGKYVSPLKIEQLLAGDDWISQAFVLGDKRKFIVGLIFPNFKNLETFASERGIAFKSRRELLDNSEIRKKFNSKIQDIQKDFAEYEKVKYFALIPDEITMDGGALTPTLKMKRRILLDKYKDEIEKMYQNSVAHET